MTISLSSNQIVLSQGRIKNSQKWDQVLSFDITAPSGNYTWTDYDAGWDRGTGISYNFQTTYRLLRCAITHSDSINAFNNFATTNQVYWGYTDGNGVWGHWEFTSWKNPCPGPYTYQGSMWFNFFFRTTNVNGVTGSTTVRVWRYLN